MLRNASHLCPVSHCGNLRNRWHAVCPGCYRRLPAPYKAALVAARAERRADVKYKAGVAARDWLNANPVAAQIARVCGEVD